MRIRGISYGIDNKLLFCEVILLNTNITLSQEWANEPEFIKLRQSSELNWLYLLLPPRASADFSKWTGRGRPRKPAASPVLTCLDDGTAKITQGSACIYIEDYLRLTASCKGGFRPSTYKLLDYLIWQLDKANPEPHASTLLTQLAIPLSDYILTCYGTRDADTPQRRKDTRKELLKDLKFLQATLIALAAGTGKDGAVRILDSRDVSRGQINIVFSSQMACYLLCKCKYMWFPIQMFCVSNKSPFAYRLGHALVLHSCIANNQIRGTEGTISVRTLLKYCRNLPSPDEVRRRNGNYKQAVIYPVTEALDALADMEIIDWTYRSIADSDDAYAPADYAAFLTDYIDYTLQKAPEGLKPTIMRKDEQKWKQD